jgi:hypothetical protein
MTPASSCMSGEHGVWYAKPELICSLTVLASARDGKGDAGDALRRHHASRAAARGPSRDASLAQKGISLSRQSMMGKSAKRFSEKIMLKQ